MAVSIDDYTPVDSEVVQELQQITGEEYAVSDPHELANRAQTTTPFPLHKWEDYWPEVVVLPGSTQEVAEIVRLANERQIPVVPRGAGSGLNDGARPERQGIVIDLKRLDAIKEIDETNMTVTVGPGINLEQLNEELRKHDLWMPDNPSSYRIASVGGRIGTSGLSLVSGISGHTRDLVVSQEVVLPTGKVVRVGDGPAKKIRKSSTGIQFDGMFIGHEGTLGLTTEATMECFPRQEAQFSAFFGFDSFDAAYEAQGALGLADLKTLAAIVIFDEQKVKFLKRDDEAYIPQGEEMEGVLATVAYGRRAELEGATEVIMEVVEEHGGEYLGQEISEGDWAARHDRYSLPLHGRTLDGQVAPFNWHCEDAELPRESVPEARERWHAAVRDLREEYPEVIDDWGCFFYASNPYKTWGSYLGEIDVGIREDELDEEMWQAWVDCQAEIGEATIELGGTLSVCHGSSREGLGHLVEEEFGEGKFEIMKQLKRTLDPNNIMNPGKYRLDEAYEGV